MSCPGREDVDPANLIPRNLHGPPETLLSRARVQSSIPRSAPGAQPGAQPGTEPGTQPASCPQGSPAAPNWVYPSEDMFFAAMHQKGSDPRPEDMPLVVSIHNMVNEQCWQHIMAWERQHPYPPAAAPP